MSVIIVLLLVSISVAGLFLAAFIWSVKNGQYEDDFSPAVRILFETAGSPARTDMTDGNAQSPALPAQAEKSLTDNTIKLQTENNKPGN